MASDLKEWTEKRRTCSLDGGLASTSRVREAGVLGCFCVDEVRKDGRDDFLRCLVPKDFER